MTERQMPLPHPQGGPPQARFHPRPGCRPALAGHKGQGFIRWLAWPGHPARGDHAASGTRRCTASSMVPPHVTASPRRPSPRLDRHVRDPSGDGSAGMMARGAGCGEKIAGYFGYTIGIAGTGPRLCARKDGAFRGTRSPPLRGICLRSRQRGVWFRMSRARVFWGGFTPLCHLR